MKSIGKLSVAATAISLLSLFLIAGKNPQAQSMPVSAGAWDSHAIEGTLVGVRVREVDPSKSEVVFLYDLDNRTETDYHLAKGPGIVIMSRLKSSGTLTSEKQVALDSAAFVPAGNRTRIEVGVTRAFNWHARMDAASQMKIRQLVADETADLGGFVLFDQSTRYQIELPGSWTEIEKAP
jgi:hypothetical protein